ncbi:hypothetical protein [Achromobacter piechaudii]|uniref:Uncharacterized protein n=1 Tax=Achromobacter piechaudii TaxID=72556 RepID=A0ABM8KY32_9BURK|nr:hypothetical protein [Achromobacter piechaudii]CAB3705259.1 hypothetical protein LMG1873_02897 [Achromobacter piechaudii]CAB3959715.1 hypothetical protein LMG6103_05896 [Achromobacter piechaudii]
MTTNTAAPAPQETGAQDLNTSEGARAYVAEYFATQIGRHDFKRYIANTLAADFACALAQHLSQLRAPVADERAAVDPCGYVAVKRSAVDWLKDKFPLLTIKAGLCERIGGRLYTITRLMRDHDAALASAPVVGEARPHIMSLGEILAEYRKGCTNTGGEGPENCPDCVRAFVSALEALNVRQASAPVAGEALARYCPGCGSVGPVGDEYRDCCPDGIQARMIPARLAEQCRDTFRLAIKSLLANAAENDSAAPQAGEAVRILFPTHLRKMWSGGEVQAWLDERQGISVPQAEAKGSFGRYRKWLERKSDLKEETVQRSQEKSNER